MPPIKKDLMMTLLYHIKKCCQAPATIFSIHSEQIFKRLDAFSVEPQSLQEVSALLKVIVLSFIPMTTVASPSSPKAFLKSIGRTILTFFYR